MFLMKSLFSKLWRATILGLVFVSAASRAAEIPAAKLIGNIDVRPSWASQSGAFATENSVELGAKIGSSLSLSYIQAFNSNLYNPSAPESASGLQPTLDAGFLRAKVSDIWKDESRGLGLHYEARAYLPIDEAAQNRGSITTIRNYLKASKKVSDVVKLTLSEVAILFINNRAGTVSPGGTATANNIFENRVYFITDVTITSKLTLSVPVMFHQTRTANFRGDAANNSQWRYHVWLWPELDYALTDNYTIGVAYYNNASLFKTDLSGTNFGSALEGGTTQLVFSASL